MNINNKRTKKPTGRHKVFQFRSPQLVVHQLPHPPINMIPQQQVVRMGNRKRPIDKALIVITKDGIDATQVQTILFTATFPCTMVGLRWELSAVQAAGTGFCKGVWAIIIARQGITVNNMVQTDGSTLFAPEQDVITWGSWGIDNNVETTVRIGDTKSMRKLMGGDRLIFIMKGIATQTTSMFGVVQFFCKT